MTDNSIQLTLASSTGTIDSLDGLEWSLTSVNTSYLTHGLLKYPAVMPPQIAANIFQFYLNQGVIEPGDWVYDPFIGSGTTLVEARLHKFNAAGNDINPFACLLSDVKSGSIDITKLKQANKSFIDGLEKELDEIEDAYYRLKTAEESKSKCDISPVVTTGSDAQTRLPTSNESSGMAAKGDRADYTHLFDESDMEIKTGWYPKPQLYQLLHVRNRLNELRETYDTQVTKFLGVVVARVTRKVSYQRRNCFKRWRMSEEDRQTHNPDVFSILERHLQENTRRVSEYQERVGDSTETIVFREDSREVLIQDNIVSENYADIVVTSPPYGDHQTTVAYGEFSTDLAIMAENRKYDEMRDVDDKGLGGQDPYTGMNVEKRSETANDTLAKLDEDEGRVDDARDFFNDFAKVIEQVGTIVKPSQPVVWVVANRRMSGENIPLSKVTMELCESFGFSHEQTLGRGIEHKNMPSRNKHGATMEKEFVVVTRGPTKSPIDTSQ